ncbi:translation initiation factor IF-2, partial [Acetobacter peroxydans]
PAARPAADAAGAADKDSAAQTLRLRAGRGMESEDEPRRSPSRKVVPTNRKNSSGGRKGDTGGGRRAGRIDVQAAIEGDDDKTRSLASVRRQRERERRQAELERLRSDQVKVVRDVILPETITVQELANRMAARQGEVIKALMKMGVMATVTQSIDADTAELVVEEFGHRVRRVSEADVELGIEGVEDTPDEMITRAPVVTVMGHVDHGKTSLLDALRTTDVAAGEAGGITQHIGAYQVTLASGAKITFLDTPGHEAFTAMRARGASMTDVVVLVVAADDGVMPQTIEAIKHAKAANVPMIVAINKIDKPGAKPERVCQELLQHEIVVESLGGDVQDIQVSALKRTGLDKLEEAILLQAEILELRANPNRPGEGSVIESRLDRGRGSVASVLVQKGTLRKGDIVVAGAEWGRVRALVDDHGAQVDAAGPSMPVEILGLSGVPAAGAPFVVVENENRAREISEFRQRKLKEHQVAGQVAARGTLDQMLARIQAGDQKEVSVLIKADVQGSAEAIQVTVLKLANEEVGVRVLNASVGQITESDVQLAKASDAVIVAFNVRATVQARQLAQREGVDIRYYSIIYQVADDVEALVRGKQAPKHREKFLGYAEIRKVFEISKVGKVAGCYVTEGVVKRGCGVRLLRDGVVIHEGDLSQLKRFKDDVKEVARSYECGLSFAGYNDLREGDVVECFESELVPA